MKRLEKNFMSLMLYFFALLNPPNLAFRKFEFLDP